MFWFESETLKELCWIAKTFSKEQKNKLQERYEKLLPNFVLTFSTKDKVLIEDHEFEFINYLVDISAENDENKQKIITDINMALSISNLKYEDGKIINCQGAYAVVQQELIAGKKYIRKRNKEKTIKKEYDFIKTLNRLDINNQHFVVKVDESFSDETTYLMEYANDSLENYINKNKQILDQAERISIVLRIIDCVLFLHTNGILHRDLHPGNILSIRNEYGIKWFVSDFGLAIRTEDLPKEEDKRSYGREDFVAPEQKISLANTSLQSDIYSVGKLINYVMTGSANKNNHRFGDVSKKCCMKDPDDRFETMFQLKEVINTNIVR